VITQPGSGNPAQPGPDEQIRVPLVTSQQAVEQGVAQVAQPPFPPLSPQEQQYLDQVLDVWEKRTAEVKRYECEFKRWQYDPTKYDQDYYSRANGNLKFMDPDKGMFVVENLETIAVKQPQAEYKVDPRRPYGEYWICDGEWIYIRDRNEKKETRYELPPQLRGQGIQMSPLPFLFGVKAAEIKQRYWIRPVQAPPGDDGVWLEAWPKRADDAGNYSRVQVVLDRSDILPRALIVFLPNWRPGSEHKEIYEFSNRVVPKENLWSAMKEKVFRQAFIPTQLPGDWQIIEEPYIPAEQQAQLGAAEAQNRTAQPPQSQPVR
jgi:TIGR03009 family protein